MIPPKLILLTMILLPVVPSPGIVAGLEPGASVIAALDVDPSGSMPRPLLMPATKELPSEDVTENIFLWKQANTMMTTARTADAYLEAAEIYSEMIARGVRNGSVYYDLGTAFLKAGYPRDAKQALLRAERYIGGRQDIRHNLMLARGGGQDWKRTFFFWHFALAARMRAAVTGWSLAACLFGLAVGHVGMRRVARIVLTVSVIVLVLFGTSVAVSFAAERADQSFEPEEARSSAPQSNCFLLTSCNSNVSAHREGSAHVHPVPADTQGSRHVNRITSSLTAPAGVTATISTDNITPYIYQDFRLTLTVEFKGIQIGQEMDIENLPPGDVLFRDAFSALPVSRETVAGRLRETRRYVCRARSMTAGRLSIEPIIRLQLLPGSAAEYEAGNIVTTNFAVLPLSFTVRPLPAAGRPDDFSGAVGDFSLQMAASPTNCVPGDSVLVETTIAGTGYVGTIAPLNIAMAPHFRLHDPVRVETRKGALATFQQSLVPQSNLALTIPSVRFTFFNPHSDQYITLTNNPPHIRLQPRTPVPNIKYPISIIQYPFYRRRAILNGDQLARFAPHQLADPTFSLATGAVVEILTEAESWLKVAHQGKIGWVPVTSIAQSMPCTKP